MNLPSFSKLTISLLLVLVACTTQATPSTPTILPPSPTPDLEIITPENVDRLIQVKQLGVGLVCGSPHFSSDGKWVYQATTTGVFAFDTKTYEGHRLISSTIAYNCSVDVSPDGKLLAVNENLFAVESGEKLPDLETSLEFQDWAGASEVKFSPDGSLLARRYYENSKNGTQFHIAIWRLADGELINIFFDVGSYYFPFISFSMDGNFLIAQSNDASNSKLDLYDIQAGVKLRSWTGVHSVLLPKSQVAIETDGVVHIIDLKTDKQLHTFAGKFPAISPNGDLIVLLDGNRLKVFSIQEEQQIATLEGVFDEVDQTKFLFSADGKILAGEITDFFVDSASGDFVLWRLPSGESIKKISTKFPSQGFSFSPDGKSIARTYGQIQFFDVFNGSLLGETIESNSEATGVAFLPNNHQLVFATSSGQRYHGEFIGDYQAPLHFYDVDSEKLYKTQFTSINPAIAFSADGKIYEPDRLHDIPSIRESGAENVAFSPDGNKIAISYIPNDLAVWDLSKKTQLYYLTDACLYGTISSLSFSSDGNRVAIACIAGSRYEGINNIRIWSATPDAQLLMDIDTIMSTSTVSFSSDGRFLASSDKNGVEVRDASNGKLLFSINEPMLGYLYYGAAGAQRVDFSPDGRILAIGVFDSTIELWNTETHQKIYSVKVIDSPYYRNVCDLDFSSDGKLLAVGFEDGAVRIYGIK